MHYLVSVFTRFQGFRGRKFNKADEVVNYCNNVNLDRPYTRVSRVYTYKIDRRVD